MTIKGLRHLHLRSSKVFCILLVFTPLLQIIGLSQGPAPENTAQNSSENLSQILRLERTEVAGGAELITVHARLSGLDSEKDDKWVPLVSVLRDTLGDANPENDRMRYVWPLTYTRPTVKQRLSAAIPFLYTRVGNKENLSQKPPPPALDLSAPESEVWEKLFWTALQSLLLDPYGTPVKASTSSYRRNSSDYRRSHIIRALSILALYQAAKGEKAFSDSEMAEMQARLLLADKTLGGLVDYSNLQNYYAKKTAQTRDERGDNLELLRHKDEAEFLYFEPLLMPDGRAAHAMLWVSKRDLEKREGAKYNGRFLNIASPWSDKRLLKWRGFLETWDFDFEAHPVESTSAGAGTVEMISLSPFRLDNTKISLFLGF